MLYRQKALNALLENSQFSYTLWLIVSALSVARRAWLCECRGSFTQLFIKLDTKALKGLFLKSTFGDKVDVRLFLIQNIFLISESSESSWAMSGKRLFTKFSTRSESLRQSRTIAQIASTLPSAVLITDENVFAQIAIARFVANMKNENIIAINTKQDS